MPRRSPRSTFSERALHCDLKGRESASFYTVKALKKITSLGTWLNSLFGPTVGPCQLPRSEGAAGEARSRKERSVTGGPGSSTGRRGCGRVRGRRAGRGLGAASFAHTRHVRFRLRRAQPAGVPGAPSYPFLRCGARFSTVHSADQSARATTNQPLCKRCSRSLRSLPTPPEDLKLPVGEKRILSRTHRRVGPQKDSPQKKSGERLGTSGVDFRLREASQRARGGATGGRGLGGPWLAESQTRWKPEPPSWGSMLSTAPDCA